MSEEPFCPLIALARSMVMEGICPWTDQQDELSLLAYLFKESEELSEALHQGFPPKEIASEVGDVLMLLFLLCFKLEASGTLSVQEIISEAMEKIRRRAPHVFSHEKISCEEARQAWLLGKLQEQRGK